MPRACITPSILASAVGHDRTAAGQVCKCMEGAIKSIALAFARRYPSFGLDDLIQEGYLAVLRSINRFDIARGGASFSSYAYEAVANKFRRLASQEAMREDRVRPTDLDGGEWEERSERAPFDPSLLDRLPRRLAQVLALRLGPILEGRGARSWRAVGRAMKITPAAAQLLYVEGTESLRRMLDEGD